MEELKIGNVSLVALTDALECRWQQWAESTARSGKAKLAQHCQLASGQTSERKKMYMKKMLKLVEIQVSAPMLCQFEQGRETELANFPSRVMAIWRQAETSQF